MEKEMKLIAASSGYYEKDFLEMCEALESGERIRVYIESIGHTANNIGQEIYKKALQEKYGEKLIVELLDKESYSYKYCYELKEND